MPSACPKCSHVRTPADTAPDWQCPQCGIAMARYIELQKQAAERKLPAYERPQRDIPAANVASGVAGGIASDMVRKVVAVIFTILVAGLIHFIIDLLRDPKPPTPLPPQGMSEQDKLWAQPRHQAGVGRVDSTGPQPGVMPGTPAQDGASAPAAPAAPDKLPVDSIADLLEAAHRQGTAGGSTLLTVNTMEIPGFDRGRLVSVQVVRREALGDTGCERFGVTLSQGGAHFVYALNYCAGGAMPVGGRSIQIE